MNTSFFFQKIARYKKFFLVAFVGIFLMTATVVIGAGFVIVSVGSWVASEIKQNWDSKSSVSLSVDASTRTPFKERVEEIGRLGVERWVSSHLVSQNFLAVSSGLKCIEYLGGPSKQKLAEKIRVYLEGKPLFQTFDNYLNSDVYRESFEKLAVPNDCVNAVMNGI